MDDAAGSKPLAYRSGEDSARDVVARRPLRTWALLAGVWAVGLGVWVVYLAAIGYVVLRLLV